MEGTHELAATQAPAQPDDDWLTPHDDTWRERQRVADRRALATLGVTVVSVVWVLVGIGTSQRHSAWEELAVLPACLALVGLRVLRPREAEASDNGQRTDTPKPRLRHATAKHEKRRIAHPRLALNV